VLAKSVASLRAVFRCSWTLRAGIYGLKLPSDSSVVLFRLSCGLLRHKQATQEIIKSRPHYMYLYFFFIFICYMQSRLFRSLHNRDTIFSKFKINSLSQLMPDGLPATNSAV
jgi:hypothetical protein